MIHQTNPGLVRSTSRLPHEALISIHEAAHCVVAVTLGQPVARVTVEPDSEALGHCAFRATYLNVHPNPTRAVQREQLARTDAMISLAGPIAEFLAAGEDDWDGCGRDDLQLAVQAIQKWVGRNQQATERWIAWAKGAAHDRVRAEWRAIERLASQLSVTQTIWGEDAEAMVVEELTDEAYRKWRWYRYVLPHP